MFGGFVCLTQQAGTSNLQGVLGSDPTSTTFQVGLVLVLVGAFAKSAQFPFHFWLPGAMAAHDAGQRVPALGDDGEGRRAVVARFAPPFAGLDWWRPLLVIVGGVTMLVGGVAALRRDDAKQLLAFGTVSQLGLLVVLFGVGTPEATAAGVVLLRRARALQVRSVPRRSGRSITRPGAATCAGSPVSVGAAVLAGGRGCRLHGSMIGLPPLLGFCGKESALASLVDGRRLGHRRARRGRRRFGVDGRRTRSACGGGCSPPSTASPTS